MFLPKRLIYKYGSPESPKGEEAPGEKPMYVADASAFEKFKKRREDRKKAGEKAREELLKERGYDYERDADGNLVLERVPSGSDVMPTLPKQEPAETAEELERVETAKESIDLSKRDEIIAKLNNILEEEFIKPLNSRLGVDPQAFDQEEFELLIPQLRDLAERMTYQAIVANWKYGDLEAEYSKRIYAYSDRIVGGTWQGELKRGSVRLAKWLAQGEPKSLSGKNPGIQKRMDENRQLISPEGKAYDRILSELSAVKRRIFDGPLNELDPIIIDPEKREFIEENIVAPLAVQVIAEVIIENDPLGERTPLTPAHFEEFRRRALEAIKLKYGQALSEAMKGCLKSRARLDRERKKLEQDAAKKAKWDARVDKALGAFERLLLK